MINLVTLPSSFLIDDLVFPNLGPYPSSEFWNNRYDIVFNKEEIVKGGAWYKGIRGSYVSYVSTSGLNAGEIEKARDYFERRFGA